MKIEITIGGLRKRELEAVPWSPSRWYLKVNGRALRDRNARLRLFRSEDAALAAGRKAA